MADLPHDAVEAASRAAWRDWLGAHHATAGHVWLVMRKKAAGGPSMTYVEAVEEALCVGWIDSTARTLDAERTMQYFTARKPRSGWARTNKERVLRLDAAGLMRPAGQATVDAARADGSWSALDDVEALVVPDDLAAALADHSGAAAHWDAFPRSARRAILAWVSTAKRPETRARRIAEAADKAGRNERAHQTPR